MILNILFVCVSNWESNTNLLNSYGQYFLLSEIPLSKHAKKVPSIKNWIDFKWSILWYLAFLTNFYLFLRLPNRISISFYCLRCQIFCYYIDKLSKHSCIGREWFVQYILSVKHDSCCLNEDAAHGYSFIKYLRCQWELV